MKNTANLAINSKWNWRAQILRMNFHSDPVTEKGKECVDVTCLWSRTDQSIKKLQIFRAYDDI